MRDQPAGWGGGRIRPLLALVVLSASAFWASWAFQLLSLQGEAAVVALETPQPANIVTGTLAMLDLSAGKGMLKTDLDKPIFFDLGRPEQFSRFSIGDRVTVQLDENGQVIKIIESLPAEVHEPPPPAK